MRLSQQQQLDNVAMHVIKTGNDAELNCNGNIFTVYIEKETGKLAIRNPLGTRIGIGVYELWRHFNNTVIDEVELLDYVKFNN